MSKAPSFSVGSSFGALSSDSSITNLPSSFVDLEPQAFRKGRIGRNASVFSDSSR